MYVLWCRLFQKVMKFFMDIVPFWRKPKMITGRDSLKKLPGTHTVSGEFSVSWSVSSPLSCFKKHSDALENTW